MTKSRGILAPRKRWSDDELAVLRRDYPDKPAQEIADELGIKVSIVYRTAHKLGLPKSAEFLASERSGRLREGSQTGKEHRFQRGWPSARKGKPFPTRGRMGLTQFKQGHMPHNARYRIGDRRINSEGYLDRKISNDRKGALNWTAEHRLVWIEANGPIPEGHVVAFKPGRRATELELITLDALELLTYQEHMLRHTVHYGAQSCAKSTSERDVKNRIEDLRNHLFATLEALQDKDKPMELDRAKAIAEVAQTIINSAKVEVEFLEVTGGTGGSGFIPQDEIAGKPSLPRLVKS